MARELIVALSVLAAASPVWATKPELNPAQVVPAAGPDARYCLRIQAFTGTILERVRCKTREEWAALEVDLDKEWPREGVAVISDGVRTPVSR